MEKTDICMTCEHYIKETDYCDLDLFDGDEKTGLDVRIPTESCIEYVWKDEKDHPYYHSLL